MVAVTNWIHLSVRPWYHGIYELQQAHDGTVRRGKYVARQWRDMGDGQLLDLAEFSAWRGRLQGIPGNKIDAALHAFRSDRNRKQARRLFRHYVSEEHQLAACRFYHIGIMLEAPFTTADKRAYRRLSKRLQEDEAENLKVTVNRFFCQPDHSSLIVEQVEHVIRRKKS